MQCSCGGSTKTDHFHRVKKMNRKTGEVVQVAQELQIEVCEACGRVGRQRLYHLKDQYNKVLVAYK